MFFLWDISRGDVGISALIQTVDYYFRMFKYQFSVVAYLATILRIKILVAMAPKVVVELKVVRIPYLTTLGPKM